MTSFLNNFSHICCALGLVFVEAVLYSLFHVLSSLDLGHLCTNQSSQAIPMLSRSWLQFLFMQTCRLLKLLSHSFLPSLSVLKCFRNGKGPGIPSVFAFLFSYLTFLELLLFKLSNMLSPKLFSSEHSLWYLQLCLPKMILWGFCPDISENSSRHCCPCKAQLLFRLRATISTGH
jgi:hypothetical protein